METGKANGSTLMDEAVVPEVTQEIAVGHTPEAVTAQYRRAVGGVLEMVRFGAMMLEVEGCLTRETTSTSRHDPSGDGPSLKGWLEAHCPEVNYKTAIRFKALAEGVRESCRLPAKVPLALALPGPAGEWVPADRPVKVSDERLGMFQRRVWDLVDGKSARQLMFDFAADGRPTGGARPGAGRPPTPDDPMIAAGAAWSYVGPKIEAALRWRFAAYLPEAIARPALDATLLLAEALKARLAELKQR